MLQPKDTPAENPACVFCKIARGEIPSPVVFEDDIALAFLDHRPLFTGHCLIIPRAHYPTLADLPHSLLTPFFADVQLLARAVEQAMRAEGSFVAANNRVSQSVLHFHFHVVPRRTQDGLRGFFWPRQKYKGDDEVRQVQEALRSAIAKIQSEH
jgi:histidine triad (HIT) family protein